jgi:hypothetical protein
MSEKRIYVVVADVVDNQWGQPVVQPAGRIAAQVGHVVSMMRVRRAHENNERFDFEPITTIVLSVRDSAELHHISYVLGLAKIERAEFWDTNEEAYGPLAAVMTAVCTHPIEPEQRENLLDHLPLWTPRCQ